MSTFSKFFDDAIVDLTLVEIINKCISESIPYHNELENRKLFHLASSAEKLSKALLHVYPAIILLPIKGKLNKDIINIVRQVIEKSKQPWKLKHKVISDLEIDKLFDSVKDLLPYQMRPIYMRIIDFLRKEIIERSLKEAKEIMENIKQIKEQITPTLNLKDKYLIEDEEPLFRDFQYIFISLVLVTACLEAAAGSITRYQQARDYLRQKYGNIVDDYLNQLRENQGNLISILNSIVEFVKRVIASTRFDEFIISIYEELSEELSKTVQKYLSPNKHDNLM